MKRRSLLTLAAIAGLTTAQAGSFQLNLQGIRQSAMGGAGTAMPWDVSTLFFNPGGLARLEAMEVQGSANFVIPNVRYAAANTGIVADSKPQVSTPFAFYAGGKLHSSDRLAFGVGVYTPFGSSIDWGNDWTGRYMVQDIQLQSIFIQPTIAYELSDIVSIGAGFVYGLGSVKIKKALPVQDISGEGQASLDGKASGIGFNVGIQVRPSDRVNLGLSFRSGVKMKVDNGEARFSTPVSLAGNFPDTRFKTELPLPNIITAGIAIKATSHLTLSGDIVYAQWDLYKKLAFDFEDNTPTLQDTDDPRQYKNTVAVRIGGHYDVSQTLELMAGFAYDPTPTRQNLTSPDAVDANRISASVGIAYKPSPRFTISAMALYTGTGERSVLYEPANFAGSYQIKSVTPAIGLSYNFKSL